MKSESQKSKHTGRKPKFDYKSEEFLSQVETYAKKGFTDREIAFALGLAPQTFCEKKNEHSELCEVLARGRATITAAVRAKFLAVALGGIKTKSTVSVWMSAWVSFTTSAWLRPVKAQKTKASRLMPVR